MASSGFPRVITARFQVWLNLQKNAVGGRSELGTVALYISKSSKTLL